MSCIARAYLENNTWFRNAPEAEVGIVWNLCLLSHNLCASQYRSQHFNNKIFSNV